MFDEVSYFSIEKVHILKFLKCSSWVASMTKQAHRKVDSILPGLFDNATDDFRSYWRPGFLLFLLFYLGHREIEEGKSDSRRTGLLEWEAETWCQIDLFNNEFSSKVSGWANGKLFDETTAENLRPKYVHRLDKRSRDALNLPVTGSRGKIGLQKMLYTWNAPNSFPTEFHRIIAFPHYKWLCPTLDQQCGSTMWFNNVVYVLKLNQFHAIKLVRGPFSG